MSKRSPPKKPQPTGVQVRLEDGMDLTYNDAVGWNWDTNGILNIASAEMVDHMQPDGSTVRVNALLASFRKWAHVKWL